MFCAVAGHWDTMRGLREAHKRYVAGACRLAGGGPDRMGPLAGPIGPLGAVPNAIAEGIDPRAVFTAYRWESNSILKYGRA